MPCSNCMVPYTHFRKEHGCSKCAYGFCEKCVSNKLVIPGLNSKPLSVCDSCYAKATGKEHIPGPNLNKEIDRYDRTPGAPKPKNWWGDDVLPPPSMRRDYLKPKKTTVANTSNSGNNGGGGGGSKDEKDMLEIQARLARLKEKSINEVKNPRIAVTGKDENGEIPTGRKVLDTMKEDSHFPGTSNGHHSTATTNSNSNAPTVSEIEERLAALRGVPVDVVRKPRLFVTNESDDDEDMELPDDAVKLLEEIERSQKRKHTGYVNEGLQPDDNSSSNNQRESCASLDSLAFKKIVKECEDTPSINSSISTSNPFPNFAESCKKIRAEAIEAEKQATKFLREHGVEPDKDDDDKEEIIPPPKNVKPLEATPRSVSKKKDPLSPKPSSPKKGFFSKLFKTNSKD